MKVDIVNLDGTHTIAKKGGQEVAYQGRKKGNTTNLLILADAGGCPLTSSLPISGNHNDAFELKNIAVGLFADVESIIDDLSGIVLNADAGFDTKEFRQLCKDKKIVDNIDENKRNLKKETEGKKLDNQLYKVRFVIEQCNAWVDNYRALVIRYMTSAQNWLQSHYLVFAAIFLKKYLKIDTKLRL